MPISKKSKSKGRVGQYWSLIKSLQTGLLLLTGIAGYSSVKCPINDLSEMVTMMVSLFLAISGSTILNMVWDRDIDARMKRTAQRPLATGDIPVKNALVLGLLTSASGVILAGVLDVLYGLVVFGGLFIDVVIYTIWLKRKTPWSIVWGGISGGMPILAGRVLAIHQIDMVGLLFLFAILLWIPTHILTFSIKNHADYRSAGIPTFIDRYGTTKTRWIIVASSILAAFSIALGLYLLGMSWGYLRLLAVLSVGLVLLAASLISKPSEANDFALFKYASVYMLGAMSMISVAAF